MGTRADQALPGPAGGVWATHRHAPERTLARVSDPMRPFMWRCVVPEVDIAPRRTYTDPSPWLIPGRAPYCTGARKAIPRIGLNRLRQEAGHGDARRQYDLPHADKHHFLT
jgi:hypothetical protein